MYQVDETLQLSQNFLLSEFACKDNSKYVQIDYRLVQKLQAMRDYLRRPISIVSGYRTPAYNKKCGGVESSQHLYGMAADIQVAGMPPETLFAVAKNFGFNGMGIYDSFIHVDVRMTAATWDERVKNKGKAIPKYNITLQKL